MNDQEFNFCLSNNLNNLNRKNFKRKIKLNIKNFKRDYKIFHKKSKSYIIIGTPILEDKMNLCNLISLLENKNDIKKINGEFLILEIDMINSNYRLISDRFSSIPLFYFFYKKKLYCSLNYLKTLNTLKKLNILKFNEYTFYEFLKFQRIFGNKTYDLFSKFFTCSSELKLIKNKIYIKKYWIPSSKKEKLNLIDFAKKLKSLTIKSISRKTKTNEKISFFLSGGNDSRAILYKLKLLKKKVRTYTFAIKKNNEVNIAKKVSKILNFKNYFVKLDENPYKNIKNMSLNYFGMNSFDHAIFLNFQNKLKNQNEISLTGWGMDIFFQGLYIPQNEIKLGKIRTFSFKEDKKIFKTNNFANYFIKNISYRLKEKNLDQLIKNKYRLNLKNKMINEINNLYLNSKKIFSNPLDIFNYMCTENLSRHYSYSNIISMKEVINTTSPIFDNDLLEFYYKIPPKYLVNKNLYREYIGLMPEALKNIKTSNDNLVFTMKSYTKILLWIIDRILSKFKFRKKSKFYNPSSERTHPSKETIVINKMFKNYLNQMKKKNYLKLLNFIDQDELKRFIDFSIGKPNANNASLIFYLITINELLKTLKND